ncbi:MAG TPA: FKBP-type peptidyl-prolyl cis-trans isomerase [Candidatus Binatia bacterium]|nr:FKBP-type peptidyl-prolyl cis-trans isomerase [Candidatus Binatia bacterium]
MRIGFKMVLLAGTGLALLQLPARAADTPAFKDDKEKASYAIGMYFGNQIKRSNMEVDTDVIVGAMKDILAGREGKLNDQQAGEAIRTYQGEAQKRLAEKNKQEGEAFLAGNKKKPGVKIHSVALSDTNSVEMQYKVITEGTGEIPKNSDMVSVNYRGTLINGKEFDSSAKHGGQPAKFRVTGVIRGWTEALQMMKVGSKWELYIPSALAYQDRGSMGIEPGSTLIFEVELMGIEAPQPVAAAQPLTSDIIKVPSAEELKKGAKIEVIKPEEAARLAAQGATNASTAGKK